MDERIGFLQMWLDAGMTLGNHTYSHLSLNDTPLAKYQDDVIKGEVITRRLMENKGLNLQYFRYPYTRSGATAEIKSALLDFLHERGYRIAPFTVENSDYAFNAVYVQALEDGDRELAERVRSAYLDFQDTIFGFFEELSVELFGYRDQTGPVDPRQQDPCGLSGRALDEARAAGIQLHLSRRCVEG